MSFLGFVGKVAGIAGGIVGMGNPIAGAALSIGGKIASNEGAKIDAKHNGGSFDESSLALMRQQAEEQVANQIKNLDGITKMEMKDANGGEDKKAQESPTGLG